MLVLGIVGSISTISTYYFKFNEYTKEVKINEKNIKSFDN
jgi:hypothetical protein